MLVLFDTAHSKVCALTNYTECYVEQAIGSGSTPIILDQLHFNYPLEDERNALIDYECYISTGDAEYIVKEINIDTSNDGIIWVEYICDIDVEPFPGTLTDHIDAENQLAADAANLALTGTGWTVGFSDVTKLRTVKKSQCTVLDVFNEICTAYNCEVMFDSVNRQVLLHQKQGADRGVYFSEQLNLTSLQVQGNSREYVTRLYPVGKDGLTIAGVNNGQKYVSNYQYSTKIVSAYWADSRYTNAQDLMEDAIERLEFLSRPTRAYSAGIVDLASVSDEWGLLDFRLGDFITIISESSGVREQQRIVKIDRYLDEPEKSTVELANRISTLDDIILRVADAADTVDGMTDTTGAVEGASVNVTTSDQYGNTVVQKLNAVVADIGTVVATKVSTDDLNANYITAKEIQADYVTADYLNANYISADSIKSTYATIDTLQSNYATIANLSAANANISSLTSNVANVNTLLAGNITASNIKAGSITAGNLAAGTITATSGIIANGAIGTAQIADGSITDAKVVDLSADSITAGTLTVDRLVITGSTKSIVYTINNVNGTPQLSQSTIDGRSLTQRTITADRIVAGAITGNEIAAKTITATNIAANTITAGQIAAGTITASQIATGTITANQIAANAITASQINVSSLISAMNISTDTLCAQRITSADSPVYATIGSVSYTTPYNVQLTLHGLTLSDTASDHIYAYLAVSKAGTTGDDTLTKDTIAILSDGISLQAGSYFISVRDFTGSAMSPVYGIIMGEGSNTVAIYDTYMDINLSTITASAGAMTINGSGITLNSTLTINDVVTTSAGFNWSNGRYAFSTHNITGMDFVSGSPNYIQTTTNSSAYGITVWTSDRSLKCNITDSDTDALADMRDIRCRSFDWKDGSGHVPLGVVSQELLEINPDFAFGVGQDDGTTLYQPNESTLIPYMIRSVQQLADRGDEQQARIALLESQVAALQAMIA